MKTPEEIKKGLWCCIGDSSYHCDKCPYEKGCKVAHDELFDDVLAYIQQLESKLAQAERERDAAVYDLAAGRDCPDCKHYEVPSFKQPCRSCMRDTESKSKWEWRGPCPENTKEADSGGETTSASDA